MGRPERPHDLANGALESVATATPSTYQCTCSTRLPPSAVAVAARVTGPPTVTPAAGAVILTMAFFRVTEIGADTSPAPESVNCMLVGPSSKSALEKVSLRVGTSRKATVTSWPSIANRGVTVDGTTPLTAPVTDTFPVRTAPFVGCTSEIPPGSNRTVPMLDTTTLSKVVVLDAFRVARRTWRPTMPLRSTVAVVNGATTGGPVLVPSTVTSTESICQSGPAGSVDARFTVTVPDTLASLPGDVTVIDAARGSDVVIVVTSDVPVLAIESVATAVMS